MRRLIGLAAALLATAGTPVAPSFFIETAPRNAALTRLLVLDADGNWIHVAGTIRRAKGRPLRLDRQRAYQLYCGTWRAGKDGTISVRDTLSESFGPPAPADAGSWRTHAYAARPSSGPAMLTADGVRYRRSAGPLDAKVLVSLRAQCATTRGR